VRYPSTREEEEGMLEMLMVALALDVALLAALTLDVVLLVALTLASIAAGARVCTPCCPANPTNPRR